MRSTCRHGIYNKKRSFKDVNSKKIAAAHYMYEYIYNARV